METWPICSVCKKKEATRRMFTQTDEGFLYLCDKKKCVEGMYEMLKPEQQKEDFVHQYTHDPLEWQGRTREQVETNFVVMTLSILVMLGIMTVYLVWSIFS